MTKNAPFGFLSKICDNENHLYNKKINLVNLFAKTNLLHVKALKHGTEKYSFRHVEVMSFAVSTGIQSITKEKWLCIQLPRDPIAD